MSHDASDAWTTDENAERDGGGAAPLREVTDFGVDPGNLRMLVAVPEGVGPRPPLVVALHGCGQTAAGFDAASGWSRLAARHGFIVLYPEQRRANNERTCFNWFQPADVARHGGEAESIRAMVERVVADHFVDPRRIFVCGFSAGGAMAVAMLATCPDVFAGGAAIAGLPYGAAAGAGEAFEAMCGSRIKEPRVWGGLVRAAASGFPDAWPSLAIWQGTADRVVKPINAGELAKQWTDLHGVGAVTPRERRIGPADRRAWCDAVGRECVVEYSLPGLGHGVPVESPVPPAQFFLPAGLSASRQIAADFGVLNALRPSRTRRLLGMLTP